MTWYTYLIFLCIIFIKSNRMRLKKLQMYITRLEGALNAVKREYPHSLIEHDAKIHL